MIRVSTTKLGIQSHSSIYFNCIGLHDYSAAEKLPI